MYAQDPKSIRSGAAYRAYVRVVVGSVGAASGVIVAIVQPTVITTASQTGSTPFVVV